MTAADSALLKRSAIAAVALILYGAGVSWIVHQEALSYRDSVRPKIVAEPVKPQPPEIKPEPPVKAIVETLKATPAEPKMVVSEAPKSPVVVVDPKIAAEKLENEELDKAAVAIWDNPSVKKGFDLDRYTENDDRELGAILNELICKIAPLAPEGTEGGRVKKAGDPLRQKMTKKEIIYTILDSDEYNIFSHPGGYIYITNGMLLRIGNDEDHVLKFAIAHEMAHLELGHTLKCLRFKGLQEIMKLTKSGTAEAICQRVIPIAYPDDMEFEADRWALRIMRELGHDEYESLRFLVKLEKIAESKNFGQGHIPARPNKERSMLDNHIRAHVAVTDRLAQARMFWNPKPNPAPK